MFFVSVIFGLCIFSIASCQDHHRNVQIVSYNFDDNDIVNGAYDFRYETSDGTQRQEFGHVLLPGTEDEHMKVNGSFSYLGPDGVTYTVRYTADDQGFHPEGDHFKVPPFVPWIHRHGNKEQEEQQPQFITGERILNAYRTTPKPTTEYLPAGSTTDQPSTQYRPSPSTPPNFFYTQTNKPTTQYLPSSTTQSYNFGSKGGVGGPQAEVILNALPQAQTPVGFYVKPESKDEKRR